MNGIEGRGRVFDPVSIVEHFAGNVIVDLASASAPFGARLKRRLLAPVQRERTARVQGPGFGLDVDDSSGAQPELCRQGAGDQRHGIGEPGLQHLAEDVYSLGQDHPVQAKLQIGVIAADMELAERILGDARGLEQQPVERLVVALRLGLDGLSAEIIDAGAEARLDVLGGNIELLGDDVDIERDASALRCGGALCRGGSSRQTRFEDRPVLRPGVDGAERKTRQHHRAVLRRGAAGHNYGCEDERGHPGRGPRSCKVTVHSPIPTLMRRRSVAQGELGIICYIIT